MKTRTKSAGDGRTSQNSFGDEPSLNDFFELVPDLLCVVSADGCLKKLNEAWEKTLGFSTAELLQQPITSLVHPDDAEATRQALQALINEKRGVNFTNRCRTKNGSYRWLEWNARPTANPSIVCAIGRDLTDKKQTGDRPSGVRVPSSDMAERKQTDDELKWNQQAFVKSEALYRQAIEVAGAVPYYESYYDNGRKIRYDFIGEGIREITGYGPEEFTAALWDTLVEEIHLIEDLEGYTVDEAIQRVRGGQNPIWKCEHRIRARDGKIHWVFEAAVELRDENGISYGSIGMYQDITERKRAEEALRESEARLKFSQQVAHVGHWTWDIVTNQVTWSDEMKRIFGVDPATFDGDIDKIIAEAIHPDDQEKVQLSNATVLVEQKPIPIEYRVIWPDKSIHIVWAEAGEKILDEQGKIIKLSGIVQDITERKQAEEKIKKSLSEKETLLRELYHRTKNNMAVIIAMLELQANHFRDERLQQEFTEAQNRIRAMALVHQKLYDANDLSRVNLRDYITDLVEIMLINYEISHEQISVISEMEDVFVLIDSAIPCGLILNELISNALKYAFPGGRQGEIRFQLRSLDSGEIELRISDNGIGLPPGFDIRRDGSLGIKNILILAEDQLQGQVTFDTRAGVSCLLKFRDVYYQPRV
jgi:two-component system response regulator